MMPGAPASSLDAEGIRLSSIRDNDLERYWSDPEVLVARALHNKGNFYAGDDSLPSSQLSGSPLLLSAFLGAKLEFAPNTVWTHPSVDDIKSLENLKFDSQNRWWKLFEESFRRLTASPDVIPVMLDFGGLLDNLAGLVGSETMLIETADRPELIKTVLGNMREVAIECYHRLFEILGTPANGTSNWLNLWSPGRTGILQNDFSIMISTDVYRELAFEEFNVMGPMYDDCIFHLDGTACSRHLEKFLLEIPWIHAVQLGSDPGTKAMEVLPAIQLLQSKGKRVYTYVFPDEIEDLFSKISPRGVCVITAVHSEEEAEDVLGRLVKVCKHRA